MELNLELALIKLIQGYKIAWEGWNTNEFIFINNKGQLVTEKNEPYEIFDLVYCRDNDDCFLQLD